MLSTRGFVTCVAVAGAILVTACGGAQSRFDAHMKRGEDYFSHNDFTKANVEFRNAMQIEPKNAKARLMAARVAERLGRPRDALALYVSLTDSDPKNLEAREGLARLLVLGRATNDAMKVIEPGLAQKPDDVTLLTLRAAARQQLKDAAGAVADADRALKIAPADEGAIQVRAGLYKASGDLAGATALVAEGVAKSPKSASLREVLTDLYVAGGQTDKAEEQMRALVGLVPNDPRFRYQLAVFYSRSKRLDDAQRVLEDTVKALPKSNEAKLTLVDFLGNQRSPAQAQQLLRQFVTQDPDNYELRLGLGALLMRSGDVKGATEAYNEIIKRDGTHPNGLAARDRLAAIAWSQGKLDEARKLLAQVLQENPHDNEALAQRAEIELASRDPAAAIGDLREVLRDHPQANRIRQMLAKAYQANGQPGLAEEALRTAMESAPADTGIRLQLAQLLLTTQRPDQALTLLEETVRNAPTNVAARGELARAYIVKRDFTAARTAAQDLQTLDPKAAIGPYMAGLAAEGLNQPDEAEKDFAQSVALEPRAIEPLTALIRHQIGHGQGDKAVELLKNALKSDPSNPAILDLLGQVYLQRNDAASAVDVLTRAKTLAPNWWVPYRDLGSAKVAAKDMPAAIATYEAGVKVAPSEPKLVSELAFLYEANKRPQDAIALYDAWYRRDPHAPGVADMLAKLLIAYRSDRASLDRARDLTAGFVSSSDGNLLDTNGWVHFKRGEYADALPILQRAAEREPNSKSIRYHLGMVELHLGKTDEARDDLQSAVSGSAKFVGVEEARATLAALSKEHSSG